MWVGCTDLKVFVGKVTHIACMWVGNLMVFMYQQKRKHVG